MLVDSTTRLDSRGAQQFTLCFVLGSQLLLFPRGASFTAASALAAALTRMSFLSRATGGKVSELALTANPVEDHQVKAFIGDGHAARNYGG